MQTRQTCNSRRRAGVFHLPAYYLALCGPAFHFVFFHRQGQAEGLFEKESAMPPSKKSTEPVSPARGKRRIQLQDYLFGSLVGDPITRLLGLAAGSPRTSQPFRRGSAGPLHGIGEVGLSFGAFEARAQFLPVVALRLGLLELLVGLSLGDDCRRIRC